MKYLLCYQKSINFHKIFARISRSATHALFLSQAIEWTLESQDGWFKKTLLQWKENTFLTRREIENAVKFWSSLGVVDAKAQGMPRTTFYRVNDEKLQNIVENFVAQESDMALTSLRGSVCQNEQASLLEMTNQFARNDKLSARNDKLAATNVTSSSLGSNQTNNASGAKKGRKRSKSHDVSDNQLLISVNDDLSQKEKAADCNSEIYPPHTPPSKLLSLDNSFRRGKVGEKEGGIGIGGMGEREKGGGKGEGKGGDFSDEAKAILADLCKISGFKETWDEYLDYRRKRKWPMTNRAIMGILLPLAKHKTVAAEYLQHTLTCGYRGVREEWIVNFMQQSKKSFTKTVKFVDICKEKATFDV